MVVLGARQRFLADEELLGSFLLRVRAPDAAGRTGGPQALAPGRHLGAEVVEVALREPHRPQLAEGEAARGTVQESPQ